MKSVSIVDYGAGNVQAFVNAYASLGIPAERATDSLSIAQAQRLILPGVGSFDGVIERLNNSGMRTALQDAAISRGIPILGVCVGMQILGRDSEEGRLEGLNWIPSKTLRIQSDSDGGTRRLPHMGWNDVQTHSHPIFQNLEIPKFYFLHSFHVVPDDTNDAIAHFDYAGRYVCAIAKRNIVGVQFHPEKSHGWGTQLLRNFYEWSVC